MIPQKSLQRFATIFARACVEVASAPCRTLDGSQLRRLGHGSLQAFTSCSRRPAGRCAMILTLICSCTTLHVTVSLLPWLLLLVWLSSSRISCGRKTIDCHIVYQDGIGPRCDQTRKIRRVIRGRGFNQLACAMPNDLPLPILGPHQHTSPTPATSQTSRNTDDAFGPPSPGEETNGALTSSIESQGEDTLP